MIFAPFWGSRAILGQLKVGLALFITLIVFPVVSVSGVIPTHLFAFALLVVKEIAIGMILGFAASLFFTGIQVAGQLISQQMGHGLANVIDPMSESQATVIGQFQFFFALLIFLLIDGHHWLLGGLISSFNYIPLGGFSLNGYLAKEMINMAAILFKIAIQISAPVLVALFLTSVSFGFIARTVPQIHILVVGFPIQMLEGI